MSPVLRSEEYGGLGKLKSYQVNIKRKEGRIIPISLNASSIYCCRRKRCLPSESQALEWSLGFANWKNRKRLSKSASRKPGVPWCSRLPGRMPPTGRP